MAPRRQHPALPPSYSDPASNGAAVTPSDTDDLATVTRGLYIGGAGDVTVDMFGEGKNLTYPAVAAGTILPFQVSRVYATGTTATDIVAVW